MGLDNDLATDDEPQTAFSNSDEDRLSDVIPDGAVLSDIPEELLGDPIDDEPSDVFSEDPMEEPTDDGIRMPDFYGSGSSIADQLAMEMGLGLSFEDNENSGDKSDAKPQESKNDLAGFSSDDDDDSHVFS